MRVIKSEKKPIKMWLDYLEDGAEEQAKNLANLPSVFSHIAIMPDAHQGYGMPIGGVLATKDVIIPNCVGVDIGCGLCAVKTSLTELDRDTIKKIMGGIRRAVPVGFNKHQTAQDHGLMPKGKEGKIIKKEYSNALKSLGTLGGGNHFIEIQKGSDGHIWIMIHSGSRNLGLKVANYYNEVAIELNNKPKKYELASLPVNSKEGRAYFREMKYCVDFALANRKLMMSRIKEIFINEYQNTFMDGVKGGLKFDEIINIAHNYASLETHFGEDVFVHRKGATLASVGTIGIIPGSQGSRSYIVEGKGHPDSFNSCSHGAGRKMSRSKAKEDLNLEEEIKKMEDLGVIHGMRNKGDLDEASSAYKDIEEVMDNQKDLVEVKVILEPLAVIKG